jgi:hypothetical protein
MIYRLTEAMTVVTQNNTLIKPARKKLKQRMGPKQLTYEPQWVKNMTKVGNLGENVAYLYLYTVHDSEVLWKSKNSDYLGYDFSVDEWLYEVKTVRVENSRVAFFMSFNEINTCLSNMSLYKVLCVWLEAGMSNISNKSIVLYCIDDFYKVLEEYKQQTAIGNLGKLYGGLANLQIDAIRVDIEIARLTPVEYSFSDDQLALITAIAQEQA